MKSNTTNTDKEIQKKINEFYEGKSEHPLVKEFMDKFGKWILTNPDNQIEKWLEQQLHTLERETRERTIEELTTNALSKGSPDYLSKGLVEKADELSHQKEEG